MSTKKLQIIGSIGNSDADTLDGKHASDFASASDVTELQSLVGDTAVSEQISNAVKVESAYFDTDAETTEGSSTPLDADTLGGVLPSGYVTQSELTTATNTINGDLANNYYTKTEVDDISAELESGISENANNITNLETNVTENYLLKIETAANSNLLGGYESTAFVQQIDSFTPTDGKITLLSTVTGTKGGEVSQMYLYGYKYGHMVIINVGFNLTSAPSTWTQTVILTGLPASRNNTQFGIVSAQDDGISHVIYVDTSGNMMLRSDGVSAGTKFYRGQIIYLTP